MNKEKVTKRLSNEGFSLVELIIVIAIMAVLVGVITPQYIKYVNKSKAAVDLQTMETLRNAMNITILDSTIASGTPVEGATANIGETSSLTEDFWREVYGIVGIATTVKNDAGESVNRNASQMTTDFKAMLKLDSSAAVEMKYTYSNGKFSVELSGGNYSKNPVAVN